MLLFFAFSDNQWLSIIINDISQNYLVRRFFGKSDMKYKSDTRNTANSRLAHLWPNFRVISFSWHSSEAFPCIGTGACRFPRSDACNVALRTVSEHFLIRRDIAIFFVIFFYSINISLIIRWESSWRTMLTRWTGWSSASIWQKTSSTTSRECRLCFPVFCRPSRYRWEQTTPFTVFLAVKGLAQAVQDTFLFQAISWYRIFTLNLLFFYTPLVYETKISLWGNYVSWLSYMHLFDNIPPLQKHYTTFAALSWSLVHLTLMEWGRGIGGMAK